MDARQPPIGTAAHEGDAIAQCLNSPAAKALAVRDRPAAVLALSALFVASILLTILRFPEGIVISSDPGYKPHPLPMLLMPAAITAGLILLLPRGAGSSRARIVHSGSIRWETAGLILLSVAFPLLVPLLPLPEDYVLLKLLMFVVIPCTVLGVAARWRGASVEFSVPAVPWWLLMLPAVLFGLLTTVGPFAQGPPATWPPMAVLLLAASATAVSAGLGEELLYRRFLQTRLEALYGRWTGILLASALFGLMHAFSHGMGGLLESTFLVIAMQGSTGLVLGLMWSRWRRLWVCVLAHVLINGLGVALHVLGLYG